MKNEKIKITILILIMLLIIIPKSELAKENSESQLDEIILGDINNDKVINTNDLILVLRHVYAAETGKRSEWLLKGDRLIAADVTENGKVNSSDIIVISRYIAASNSSEIAKKHPDWVKIKEVQRNIEIESIKLDKTELELEEEQTDKLIATILPENATDKTVLWESSDEKIVSADNDGNVKAIKEGKAVIIAKTLNGKEAQCNITVSAKSSKGNNTTNTSNTTNNTNTSNTTNNTNTNNTTNRTNTSNSTNKTTTSNTTNRTTTSNTTNRTTTSNTTNRTNTSNSTNSTNSTNTTKGTTVEVTSIKIENDRVTTEEGQKVKLKAIVKPDNATNKTITWTTSDKNLATVDKNGIVTTRKPGSVTITAKTANGKTATAKITITVTRGVKPTSVTIENNRVTTEEGQKVKLKAIVKPDNAVNKALTWTSSDKNLATVDENGVVTTRKPGSVTITAETTNGKKATAKITITITRGVKPTSVTIENNRVTTEEGQKVQLKAIVKPDNAVNKTLTWTSSDKNLATVNQNGLVTTIKPGTAKITAETSNGKKSTATITITKKRYTATISIENNKVTTEEGQKVKLKAVIKPDFAKDEKITWSSSNSSYATVDSSGTVITKKPGTATITAKLSNGNKATATITITKKRNSGAILPTSVKINQGDKTLKVGETVNLTATVSPSNATNKTVTWKSSNGGVASVLSTSGKVTARKVGKAVITASTSNGKTATVTITVTQEQKNIAVTRIEFNLVGIKNEIQYKQNVEKTLTAVAYPVYATNREIKSIKSSDNNIVSITMKKTGVEGEAILKTKKPGTATITAETKSGFKSSFKVIVYQQVNKISLNKTSMTIEEGMEERLTATISPNNATNKKITWKSEDTSIATVSDNGLVIGKKAGKTTIKAEGENNKQAKCTVTVKATKIPATSIQISPVSKTLKVGETVNFTATIKPNNATNKTVKWKSSNGGVASIHSETGKLTARKIGKATITASTTNGKTATATVTIVSQNVEPTGISVNQRNVTLNVGQTAQLSATVLPTYANNKTVTWKSSNGGVASVHSTSGKVTARKVGTATITASTKNGKTATVTVTVKSTNVSPTSISINQRSVTLNVGQTAQLSATVLPTNATNKAVTWKSSNGGVASVYSTSGKVTARKVGTATITASTVNGKTATVTVTVKPLPTSITIENNRVTTEEGQSVQLKVKITPSSATNATITWTSSDTSVATVNSSGKVTTKKAGRVTITAKTSNGKTATAIITVTKKRGGGSSGGGSSGGNASNATVKINNGSYVDYQEGSTFKLTATTTPSGQKITWSSSNTSVATVDSSGTVITKKAGSAIITAALANGNKATIKVNVTVRRGR